MKKYEIIALKNRKFTIEADSHSADEKSIEFIINNKVVCVFYTINIIKFTELYSPNLPFLGDRVNPNYKAE